MILVVCCSNVSARIADLSFSKWILAVALVFGFTTPLRASEIDDVKNFYRAGDYAACIQLSAAQVERGVWNELWSRMLIESYLATGEYTAAVKAYEKAMERFAESIRLRLLGVRVYKMNNSLDRKSVV